MVTDRDVWTPGLRELGASSRYLGRCSWLEDRKHNHNVRLLLCSEPPETWLRPSGAGSPVRGAPGGHGDEAEEPPKMEALHGAAQRSRSSSPLEAADVSPRLSYLYVATPT